MNVTCYIIFNPVWFQLQFDKKHKYFILRVNWVEKQFELILFKPTIEIRIESSEGPFPSSDFRSFGKCFKRAFYVHWENFISISFHIEWNMIVVTVFLLVLSQMEFHFVQNRNENCHHDHISFNVKRNEDIAFSMHR